MCYCINQCQFRNRKYVGKRNAAQIPSNLHSLEKNIYINPTSDPDIIKGDHGEGDQCCVENDLEEKDTQI